MTPDRSTRTFTGVVVVVTAAVIAVALTLGALWAYLVSEDTEAGRELLVQAVAALGVLTALAARTRPDPEVQQVQVTNTPGEPIPTEPVGG